MFNLLTCFVLFTYTCDDGRAVCIVVKSEVMSVSKVYSIASISNLIFVCFQPGLFEQTRSHP